MLDLRPDLFELVQAILRQFVPAAEVWAFGSRVTGSAKEHSDLDLVVVAKEPLPKEVYYRLQDAFEESALPMRVDVLDWHRITPAFRANIEKRYEVIWEG